MRLAAPAPPEMLPWLAERAHIGLSPALRAIAAIDDDGQIAGMVGYDGWLPNACSMHVALEKRIAGRDLLRAAFGIPFIECGFAFVVAPVVSTNEKAIRLDEHLGFKHKARFRDAFGPGRDLVLMEMRREDCRWIRERAVK